MASFISTILKTEITFIPSLLEKFLGNYYNNTLCNGATWMFALWSLLHVLFDNFLNALLKKMRYKEYLRVRLKQSFWYMGFYGTAFLYCTAILIQDSAHFFTLRQPFDSSNAQHGTDFIILGYIVLATFFLHSAAWEGLKYQNKTLALNQLFLFLLFYFAYYLRFIGGSLKLTILLAISHTILEITRSVTLLVKMQTSNKSFINWLFWSCILIFFLSDILILPSMLAYPLLLKLPKAESFIVFILFVWLLLEVYDSVLYKTFYHWLYHCNETEKFHCNGNIFECSLFHPRNDVTFHIQVLKQEMKEREEKSLSLRKPKNRNVVMQTLKCMVALKRKLKQKREGSDSQESDQDDNGGSNSDNAANNTDQDEDVVGGKLQFSIQGNKIDFSSQPNLKSKQD